MGTLANQLFYVNMPFPLGFLIDRVVLSVKESELLKITLFSMSEWYVPYLTGSELLSASICGAGTQTECNDWMQCKNVVCLSQDEEDEFLNTWFSQHIRSHYISISIHYQTWVYLVDSLLTHRINSSFIQPTSETVHKNLFCFSVERSIRKVQW